MSPSRIMNIITLSPTYEGTNIIVCVGHIAYVLLYDLFVAPMLATYGSVPMFPGTYVLRYLCSPVPMFPGTYVPRTYVSQYLCSPVLLSLQIVMIIVIFALVASLSVRQRPVQFGYTYTRTPARTPARPHAHPHVRENAH